MDQQGQNGLLSTFREGWRTRNIPAIGLGVLLMAFYVTLYFTDELNPVAEALGLRSKWFLYGAVYTVAMSAGAVYYLRRHGNSAYNRKRITVNLLVQVLLAFTLPVVMPYFFTSNPAEFSQYEAYVSYLWPLAWYDLQPGTLESKTTAIAVWSIAGALVLAPIMAYRYGKRWYCSWVCGCGGLANTFGDPWRHLTSSSKASWKFEKVAVHTVMVLAIVSTLLIVVDHYVESGLRPYISGGEWYSVKALYGLIIGSILSGVIGTAVYPVFGPRIWCRNFCPMAAMLGLMQKLGRFQISVKKDMCISCGNCTTYCEMGIDVRDYAQKNESFTRASCVGCGMCAHVCPRGVLKLENVDKPKKTSLPIIS
ncbi:MAG: ferredoxin-type protein NapH [Polyangiales bacterium]|jgi:ferredoxin-type protein NapH